MRTTLFSLFLLTALWLRPQVLPYDTSAAPLSAAGERSGDTLLYAMPPDRGVWYDIYGVKMFAGYGMPPGIKGGTYFRVNSDGTVYKIVVGVKKERDR